MKSKIIITFFIFLLHFISVNAQNQQTIDSLLLEIKNANDTTEINLNIKIAEFYINNEPDSTLIYANIALEKAKSINFENGLSKAYQILGDYYNNIGEFNLSDENYDKALIIYEKLENKNNIALIYISKAGLKIIYNNFLEAFSLLNKAKILGNEQTISYCNYSLAFIYSMIENYEKSMQHILLSLKFYEAQKDNFQIAHCNNLIGDIYLKTNKDSLAFVHFTYALNIYKNRSEKDYAFALGNIAIINRKQGKYKEAISTYEHVIEIYKNLNDIYNLAKSYLNLGNTYLETNNFTESEKYFNRAKKIYLDLNNPSGLSNIYQSLASLYKKNNNKKKSIEFFLKSNEIAEKYQITNIIRDNNNSLFEIYLQQKKYKRPIDYLLKHIEIKDSIFTLEKEKSFNNLIISYETDKKEQKINYLHNENQLRKVTIEKQKKNSILLIFVLVIFIISSVLFFILYKMRNNAYKHLVQKNKELILSEKKFTDVINKKEIYSADNLSNKIIQLVEKDKIFLDKEISLSKIATMLNSNTRYVSDTIKNSFEKNFSFFINEYRIKYACTMLHAGDFNKFTLDTISKEAGFNSVSTFISYFKKVNGVTPSFYIKELKKNI